VKEDAPDKTIPLPMTGKNIIVGVPGAFSGTCSNSHVPGYLQNYEKFKAKGINEIFVVAVNDVFVMKAWKEKLAPTGTPVRFIADDKGSLVSSLGLLFDASNFFGAPRAKRFVLYTEGDKVQMVAVEEVPGEVKVTGAETILAQL
ncbi:Redoxin, partial [Dendrothele bispora CBS 962.96]